MEPGKPRGRSCFPKHFTDAAVCRRHENYGKLLGIKDARDDYTCKGTYRCFKQAQKRMHRHRNMQHPHTQYIYRSIHVYIHICTYVFVYIYICITVEVYAHHTHACVHTGTNKMGSDAHCCRRRVAARMPKQNLTRLDAPENLKSDFNALAPEVPDTSESVFKADWAPAQVSLLLEVFDVPCVEVLLQGCVEQIVKILEQASFAASMWSRLDQKQPLNISRACIPAAGAMSRLLRWPCSAPSGA